MTYLGTSYGTVIGQAYAELYPDKIRVMALDGCPDHSLSEASMLAAEVYSYEDEVNRFSTWCAATRTCPLYSENVTELFASLTSQADQTPIPAPECVKSGLRRSNVTGQEIRFNFQALLVLMASNPAFELPGWAGAAVALQQASHGNASLLASSLARFPNDTVIVSNGIAQLCLDWNHMSKDLASLVYEEQMTRDIAPPTQGGSASFYLQSACIGWPESVKYPPHWSPITETAPILLTNAYHDPETPYVDANGLRERSKYAVLATRQGDGLTSYYLGGDTYKAINDYLVTTRPPPANTLFMSQSVNTEPPWQGSAV